MDLLNIVNTVLSFILFLYSEPTYPRKLVQEVIDFLIDFIRSTYLPSLKNDIIEILKKENITADSLEDIKVCFTKHSNVFDSLSTEFKRFNLLKRKGYTEPDELLIGDCLTEKLVGNKIKLVPEFLTGIYVPLQKSLKCFLEIPGIFSGILEYMQELSAESNIITNIIQGSLWLNKYSSKFNQEIVLPLFIFYDEVEVGNPLGSHAGVNKFGVIYAYIACLPPRIASKLSSILFSMLIYSADKKKCTNERVFGKLIEELNFLQRTGIFITVNGVPKLVKFQLVLILGDNLGLNSILGFIECFKNTVCCRICTVSSETSATLAAESESLLRNCQNYEEAIKQDDSSKSGIKERCVFNKVDNFNVTENLTVDIMHDVLEGVGKYVMQSLLYTFIFIKQYFTLEDLNRAFQNFDYGSFDKSNKPPPILFNRIKNKMSLKMSAAEMLNFIQIFSIVMGHHIPEHDKHWKLFKYLRQILDIILSPRVIRSDSKRLDNLVKKLNNLYVEHYGALQPKFHNLLHYGRILLQNGPLVRFSSMRYESRHRSIKASAQASSCKINLLKTVATKQIFQMCYLMHNLEFDSKPKFGTLDETDCSAIYNNILQVTEGKQFECFNYVEIDNITYKIGSLLVINMQASETEFGKIEKIIGVNNEIYFYFEVFEEITFDAHYHAYLVKPKNELKFLNSESLPNIAPCLSVETKNEHFIVAPYLL